MKVQLFFFVFFNPIALRQAKTVYNFGLSECKRVHDQRKCTFKMNALPSILFSDGQFDQNGEKKFRLGGKNLG